MFRELIEGRTLLKKVSRIASAFATIALLPSVSSAQFPLDLNQNNPEETITIMVNKPADATQATLILTIFDADNNEGSLVINNNVTIPFFEADKRGGNNQVVELTYDLNINAINNGANTLSFRWTTTNGYRVDAASIIAGNVPIITRVKVTANMAAGELSATHKKALKIYERITDTTVPADHPVILSMRDLIAAGNDLGAAELATQQGDFYNQTLKAVASRISTQEVNKLDVPFNDLIATFIGVAYNNEDARTLLTGNFTYRSQFSRRQGLVNDIITSNNHYLDLEGSNLDVVRTLVKSEGQQSIDGNGNAYTFATRDAAGLLTTRAFMESHATAGTNRRIIKYAFNSFLCRDVEQWADTLATDAYIRRDVDRAPAGEPAVFQGECSSCHRPLDGLAPATALFDFENGFIKHASRFTPVDDMNGTDESSMYILQGVSGKVNHNDDVYPAGYVTVNDSWVNLTTSGSNAQTFGWQGTTSGAGMNDLGRMIASADQFGRCMAERAFEQLCKRQVSDLEKPLIDWAGKYFSSNGHNLRKLYEQIVIRPECIGTFQ